MKKKIVSVIFDRKKRVPTTGEGKVELCIYFCRTERKYITIHTCSLISWKKYQKSNELKMEVSMYEQIVEKMITDNESLTVENLDRHLGLTTARKEKMEIKNKLSSPNGFIEFIHDCISKEKLSPATVTRKRVTIDALLRFGKLNRFIDLTDRNVKAFDDFLRMECPRTSATIHNYHKIVKMYTNLAFQMGLIKTDPYQTPLCHFERGKYKERKPLTEAELLKIRNAKLPPKEARVRDLFIFCAYTGLAYIDSQIFDYFTMTEECNDFTYIDGQRVKTGNTYFTPILPPAMEILKKYNFKLPHISNQKANDNLHLIEDRLNINKPMTTHVARHSFATLCLSYDIPIENVARMMGHSNIRTTQVYARILKSTIERHTEDLVKKIK